MSNKLLQDPRTGKIITVRSDQHYPIVPQHHSVVKRQFEVSSKGLLILALLALLGLSLLSALGPDLAFMSGRFALFAIGIGVGYTIYQASRGNMLASALGASGFLIFLKYVGVVDSLIIGMAQMVIAMQHMAGVISVGILAALVAVLVKK